MVSNWLLRKLGKSPSGYLGSVAGCVRLGGVGGECKNRERGQ